MTVAQSVQQPLPVAEPIEWMRRPDDEVAHAFLALNGRGWLRSKCRRLPPSIALMEDVAAPHCAECAAIVEGLTPSEARLMDGDR